MKTSGQSPFVFSHRDDLHSAPGEALQLEVNLHGGFAVDKRPDHGQAYYGMPGSTYLLCQSWNPGYYFVLAME